MKNATFAKTCHMSCRFLSPALTSQMTFFLKSVGKLVYFTDFLKKVSDMLLFLPKIHFSKAKIPKNDRKNIILRFFDILSTAYLVTKGNVTNFFFDFLTSLGIVLGVCIRNWPNFHFWAVRKMSKM